MILPISGVLTPDQISGLTARIGAARLVDGTATAGWHAKLVKRNAQVASDDPALAGMKAEVEAAVRAHPVASMAARPMAFGPILFSRYEGGQTYGSHVDDALMGGVRTDLSFTLFLAEPETYQGGELVMETSAGDLAFKLPAGAMLLYPSTTLHRVEPVTSGVRLCAVGWIRSHVRDAGQREILFDLDTARHALFQAQGKTPEFDLISKSLSNLLRRWAD
ncbi:MAG TPA: Fe2+-dependent dioxygenase [Azospirillaceae bacterium]|nr:Fe2+-dependent dioxygenase [Azospirillaceae bacterium]